MRQGNLLVVRFADGEDLLESMALLLKKEKVFSGFVIGGVGMLKPVTLGFYKGGGDYRKIEVREESELCSLNGNISVFENDLFLHLHGVVGRQDGSAVAGHILSARVHLTSEVSIFALPEAMVRKLDPSSGLKKLEFNL
ncbi:MAG: PPC domain-containing DNA-binding protein [bacterium]